MTENWDKQSLQLADRNRTDPIVKEDSALHWTQEALSDASNSLHRTRFPKLGVAWGRAVGAMIARCMSACLPVCLRISLTVWARISRYYKRCVIGRISIYNVCHLLRETEQLSVCPVCRDLAHTTNIKRESVWNVLVPRKTHAMRRFFVVLIFVSPVSCGKIHKSVKQIE